MKRRILATILAILTFLMMFAACGKESAPTPSVGLEFRNNDDGKTCTVFSIGTCTDSQVVIPKEQNGYAVTSINYDAFFRNQNITSVIIPNGVISIRASAFAVCIELSSVTIPKTVTEIGDDTFCNCIKLETIIYKGTKEQWNKITFHPNWDYGAGNYTVICTDGEIVKQIGDNA